MGKIILLLLIVVSTIEIAILILFGNLIGIPFTILFIILTGVIGAWLAKKEGLHAFRNAQLDLSQGRVPNDIIIDGICILVGGVLLLTPGLVTDGIGFFLLIPQTRNIAKAALQKMLNRAMRSGKIIFVGGRNR